MTTGVRNALTREIGYSSDSPQEIRMVKINARVEDRDPHSHASTPFPPNIWRPD